MIGISIWSGKVLYAFAINLKSGLGKSKATGNTCGGHTGSLMLSE